MNENLYFLHRLITPSIFISVQILKIMAFLSFLRSVSMFEAGNGSYSKCHCLLCEDSITWIILGLRTYVFPGNEYATHDRRFYYGDFNCYQFNIFQYMLACLFTTQKMKFCIDDFFSKCDQIRRKLRIWSHLLKKSLMKNFIFVQCVFLKHTIKRELIIM